MKDPKFIPVDLSYVLRATDRAKAAVERYTRVVSDPDQAERLAKNECVICFYADGRIGGAAMTTAMCGVCKTPMHYGNTCTDAVCDGCAKRLGICHHCGADMRLVMRRKWEAAPPSEGRAAGEGK